MSVVEDRVCVKYEIGYKSQEMEKVDLKQYFDDGTKKSHKVPKFTGKEGAEGLVYVYKSFKKAAEHLSFDEGDELFMNWEFCLSSTAEESWKTLMDLLEDEEKTPELFEECYQTFLLQYCTADARDILIDYLKTSSCKKPHDADVRMHSERIRSLCVLANYLPGTMPEINDAMRKKMLVDTFPADWQVAFHSTKEIANVTEQQIVSFMCLQKTAADSKERKRSFEGRGGGPPAQRGRFGGRGPGRGFGMNGKGFGGRGFNNGGRFGNFFGNGGYNNNNNGYQQRLNGGNGFNGGGNFNGGRFNNNGNGGRFQGRFQNFNGGRASSGRAPLGREPAARQHQNYMIEGREPQDGRAYGNENGSSNPGSSTHEHYYYDGSNGHGHEYDNNYGGQQQYYDNSNNWQNEYGGFDNFYTDYDESQRGW